MAKAGDVHVALMRGLNLGPHNRIPMKDLCALFTRAGCANVQSYIQSGNVIFRAEPAIAKSVAATVSAKISSQFGMKIPIVTRSAPELARVLRANPFFADGADEKPLYVFFLEHAPKATAISALDPARSPPDRFEVRGREVFLHLVNGAAKTKLTNAYFDAKLTTVSTARNWRTVGKLVELAGAG